MQLSCGCIQSSLYSKKTKKCANNDSFANQLEFKITFHNLISKIIYHG